MLRLSRLYNPNHHLPYRKYQVSFVAMWKKTISEYKIWINHENINNSFRKTNSGPGVKVEKIGRTKKGIGWKSKSLLINIMLTKCV